MNIKVSARARREGDRRDAWWRANRPEADNLFTRELLHVIERLGVDPELGTLYEAARFETPVRRVLMPGTETHVYHAIVDGNLVVLAIWGARRGRGPKL